MTRYLVQQGDKDDDGMTLLFIAGTWGLVQYLPQQGADKNK